jgi:hypothetical protein
MRGDIVPAAISRETEHLPQVFSVHVLRATLSPLERHNAFAFCL